MDRQTSLTAKRFAKLLKKNMNVNRLILFGSRARGDNFVSSDFDFILVSGDFRGMHFMKRASRIYEFWDMAQDLEILCYTPEEWERLKNSRGILLNAQKDGVCIA